MKPPAEVTPSTTATMPLVHGLAHGALHGGAMYGSIVSTAWVLSPIALAASAIAITLTLTQSIVLTTLRFHNVSS
jgi:hypothetical protein